MTDIEVEIVRHPTEDDWALCKRAALNTMGKTGVRTLPDDVWKHDILMARHSPIRVLMFYIHVTGIPSYCATHFARHVHLTPFIQSQRNDRQRNYDRNEAPQGMPVMMDLWLNAEELMTIANKRLCNKADRTTREACRKICEAVVEVNPEFEPFLKPWCECVGPCREMFPCWMEEGK